MPLTVASSDFMNYKFLSSLFDFRNSAENDVFPLFCKDIFPFLNLTKGCKIWDGNESQSHTADTWWNIIKEWRNHLPMRTNAYIEGDDKYKAYQNILLDFTKEIKDVLLRIEFSANQKLKDLFHLPVTIKFETQAPRFNCLREGYIKSKDGILHSPKILIRGEIYYDNIAVTHSSIEHPKTFFNEAKLSCISLAIRLAFFDLRLQNTIAESAEVLAVDDLLLSLDMSNRMKVVEVLLNYEEKCQMLVFTHDKSFFEMFYNSIPNNKKSHWKKLELYKPNDSVETSIIPTCHLIQSKDYMEKALAYYREDDFAACANCLRKKCEQIMKYLLPTNWLLQKKDDGTIVFKDLSGMLNQLPQFYTLYDLPNLTPKLDQHRRYVLNPLSHDDIDAPIYRMEIDDAIKEIRTLGELEYTNIIGGDDIATKEFKIQLDNAGQILTLKFVFIERFGIIKYNRAKYYESSSTRITFSTDEAHFHIGKEQELHKLYKDAVSKNGFHVPGAVRPPLLEECISRDEDGFTLQQLA